MFMCIYLSVSDFWLILLFIAPLWQHSSRFSYFQSSAIPDLHVPPASPAVNHCDPTFSLSASP